MGSGPDHGYRATLERREILAAQRQLLTTEARHELAKHLRKARSGVEQAKLVLESLDPKVFGEEIHTFRVLLSIVDQTDRSIGHIGVDFHAAIKKHDHQFGSKDPKAHCEQCGVTRESLEP